MFLIAVHGTLQRSIGLNIWCSVSLSRQQKAISRDLQFCHTAPCRAKFHTSSIMRLCQSRTNKSRCSQSIFCFYTVKQCHLWNNVWNFYGWVLHSYSFCQLCLTAMHCRTVLVQEVRYGYESTVAQAFTSTATKAKHRWRKGGLSMVPIERLRRILDEKVVDLDKIHEDDIFLRWECCLQVSNIASLLPWNEMVVLPRCRICNQDHQQSCLVQARWSQVNILAEAPTTDRSVGRLQLTHFLFEIVWNSVFL